MSSPSYVLFSLALAVSAAPATAQDDLPAQRASAIAGIEGLFRTPIHTGEPDELGRAYGLWASGDGYKVSFHDGVSFIPVLGAEAPTNLPLRWSTVDVRVGDHSLLPPAGAEGPARSPDWSDWRCEYRYGAVTEAYDVLADGVEQTFVLHQRPRHAGALEIRGRVDTRLAAAPTPLRHGALEFADAGGVVRARYGAAFAIDAHGARRAMSTAWDGSQITLSLDADWLARAAFPVVVDPLLAPVLVASGATMITDVAVVSSDLNTRHAFAYTRHVSGSDHDLFVRFTDGDYRNGTWVFGDVRTTTSVRRPALTLVDSSAYPGEAVVVAFEFRLLGAAFERRIGFHVHDFYSRVYEGSMGQLVPSTINSYRHPALGGGVDDALLVFERDPSPTGQATDGTELLGAWIDVATRTTSLPIRVTTSPNLSRFDREWPSVSPYGYRVAWQEYDNTIAGDDWSIRISAIPDGPGGTVFDLGTRIGDLSQSVHSLHPQINGDRVIFATLANTGTRTTSIGGSQLLARSFDLSVSSNRVTLGRMAVIRRVATRAGLLVPMGLAYGQAGRTVALTSEIAFPNGDFHVDRIGYDLGVVESHTVASPGPSTACGIAGRGYSASPFHTIAHHVAGGLTSLYASRLDAPRPGAIVTYGSGCGAPYNIVHGGLNSAGSSRFCVGTPLSTAATGDHFLAIGLARDSIPLVMPGAVNCRVLVGPQPMFIAVPQGRVGPFYIRQLCFPVSSSTPNIRLYFQYFVIDPATGWISSTQGLEVEFR